MFKIGPAGNSVLFYAEGNKTLFDVPPFLKRMGLTAYEYQCGNGIRISQDTALKFGELMNEAGIFLSIHAPYYISLSSVEEDKRLKSVKYIHDTLNLAKIMGAKRIVVHSGSCAKITRSQALDYACDTLARVEVENFQGISVCLETMGKINQLGTCEEVMELCKVSDTFLPVIDFGHLNARGLGCLKEKKDFEYIFDCIERALGRKILNNFHIHYSRIEYTKGGEKQHRMFSEEEFGPDFDYIAEIITERKLEPVIICESRDTMAEDAVLLKAIMERGKLV